MELRLQSALAKAGFGSRRNCEKIILDKRVTVNGAIVEELGTKVLFQKDDVRVDGRSIVLQEKVYYALHKPKGYICTNRDTHKRPKAIDLIRDQGKRLFSVGRLDKDTEGLIVITNDGTFANRILHPAQKVEKTYEIITNMPVSARHLRALRRGVVLDGRVTLPAKAIRIGKEIITITITEGRNRQVRRMLNALGYKVLRLKRTRIGPIILGSLPPGESRVLKMSEIDMFLKENPVL